jgi:hypothetical protein
MGRATRKSRPQRMLRSMTRGLPLPVRMFVNSRTGLLLLMIGLPSLLLLTGIVTWNWDDGKPEITVDRERIGEVEARVSESVDAFSGRVRSALSEKAALRAPDGSFNPFWSASEGIAQQETAAPRSLQQVPSFDAGPGAETVEPPPMRQSLFGDTPPRWR